MISHDSWVVAGTVARHLLVGAYLDSILVYSSSVVLSYSRLGAEDRPASIWLVSNGYIQVNQAEKLLPEKLGHDGDRRAWALYGLSKLIGEDICSVDISRVGVLTLGLGGAAVDISSDSLGSEEIWSITSVAPNSFGEPQWSVSLDDAGVVTSTYPGGYCPA